MKLFFILLCLVSSSSFASSCVDISGKWFIVPDPEGWIIPGQISPTESIRMDIEQKNCDFKITVYEKVSSTWVQQNVSGTLMTMRLDPGLNGANWKLGKISREAFNLLNPDLTLRYREPNKYPFTGVTIAPTSYSVVNNNDVFKIAAVSLYVQYADYPTASDTFPPMNLTVSDTFTPMNCDLGRCLRLSRYSSLTDHSGNRNVKYYDFLFDENRELLFFKVP